MLEGFVHNNKTNKTKLIHVCCRNNNTATNACCLIISFIVNVIVFFSFSSRSIYNYIRQPLPAHKRLESSCAPIEFNNLCNRSTVILACSPAATVSS